MGVYYLLCVETKLSIPEKPSEIILGVLKVI